MSQATLWLLRNQPRKTVLTRIVCPMLAHGARIEWGGFLFGAAYELGGAIALTDFTNHWDRRHSEIVHPCATGSREITVGRTGVGLPASGDMRHRVHPPSQGFTTCTRALS
jgi:hypothetical protein